MNIYTRLFTYEYALACPGPFDEATHHINGLKAIKASIIRLYTRGISDDDQVSSAVVHVHGYYPYFYAQVTDDLTAHISDANAFTKEFGRLLDLKLIDIYPQLVQQITSGVHEVQLVKAKAFTGFHQHESVFLKIFVTEQNLVQLVANVIRRGLVFGHMDVFETHISTFMKFIVDLQISLNNGIRINNCVKRDSQSQNLMTTCDYEFDCFVSDIQPTMDNNEEIINQGLVLSSKVTQIKTKTSPELLGQLAVLQQQRKKLLSQIQQQQEDESQSEIILQEDEQDKLQQQPVVAENQENKNDIRDELELDVHAFDQELQAGGNENASQPEKSGDDEESVEIQLDNSDMSDFQKLHYSNSNDVPKVPYVWAGKEYNYGVKPKNTNDKELLAKGNVDKESNNQESPDVVSISSDDQQIIQTGGNKAKFPNYKCYSLTSSFKEKLQKCSRNVMQNQVADAPKHSIDSQQSQSQLDDFEKLYKELAQSSQDVQSGFYSVLHMELSPLNDVLICNYYNSEQLQLVKHGISNILEYCELHIYLNRNIIGEQSKQYTMEIEKQMSKIKSDKYKVVEDTFENIIQTHLPNLIQELDPDIILSWQLNHNGLGRIVIKAMQMDFDILGQISRTPFKQSKQFHDLKKQFKDPEKIADYMIRQGMDAIGLSITGRLVFSVQFLFKMQNKLNNYTMQDCLTKLGISDQIPIIDQNITNAILSKNRSFINQSTFTSDGFYHLKFEQDQINNSGNETKIPTHAVSISTIYQVIHCAQIIQKLNFLVQASETSALFKIPFYESIVRGSQYKVEAFLFEESRKQNYILGPSPTRYEVSKMRAMEAIPLVAEPCSGYYEYPLLVFDFASLYPSVICAYNLCYCTIMQNLSQVQTIGPFNIKFRKNEFQAIDAANDLIFSPYQCFFVKSRIREGILPKLMKQSLAVRKQIVQNENKAIMQKDTVLSFYRSQNFQRYSEETRSRMDRAIQMLQVNISKMHARQMALKGLMNTTYGYTSASFTGRMPCSLIADSIVEISRQTLDFCIKLVEEQYNCQVLYADTDNMFVYTKKHFVSPTSKIDMQIQANQIGKDILQAINSSVPPPMRIKLERIYMPCILVTKKRYVGQSFNPDTIDQMQQQEYAKVPRFIDAKGIEMIRREVPQITRSCVAKALEIIFDENDLSRLKQFFLEFFMKYVFEKSSYMDFVFQRKCRLQHSSSDRSLTANIATRGLSMESYCLLPEYGERVSYVIVKSDHTKLIDSLLTPQNLACLDEYGQQIYSVFYSYYLEKQIINPCQRLMGLCGFSVENVCKEVALYCLQNQALLSQNIFIDQHKFRQLVSYFAKMRFKDIEYQKTVLIPIFFNLKLFKNYYSSQFYNIKHRQQGVIIKRVSMCIVCGRIQNNIVDRVSICQQCVSLCTQYKNVLQCRFENQLFNINMLICNELQNCQQCFYLDKNNSSFCANFKCQTYKNLMEYRKIEKIVKGKIQVMSKNLLDGDKVEAE